MRVFFLKFFFVRNGNTSLSYTVFNNLLPTFHLTHIVKCWLRPVTRALPAVIMDDPRDRDRRDHDRDRWRDRTDRDRDRDRGRRGGGGLAGRRDWRRHQRGPEASRSGRFGSCHRLRITLLTAAANITSR